MSGASTPRLLTEVVSMSRSHSPPPSVPNTTRRSRSQGGSTSSENLRAVHSSGDVSGATSGLQCSTAQPSGSLSAEAHEPNRSHSLGTTLSPTSPQCTSRPLSGGGRHSATALAATRPASVLIRSTPRRRMRSSCTSSPTLAIAEAEAVRAAREFSLDMYRALHQRKFKSLHEELDFLRKDFVASRKTLALLHGDKVRLERELMARVLEMNELQGKLEEAQSEAVQQTPSQCWRVGSSGSRGRRCSGCGCGEQDLDDFGQCAVCKAPGTRANAGDMVQVSRDTAADCGDEGERQRRCGSAKKSSEVKAPSHVSTRHAGLSLYAASGQQRSGAAAAGGRSARGPDNIDPQELIRDLRANLSRRDTALNEAQMELGSLQQIRRTLETERRRLQDNLSEVKTQRDALQTKLTSQEELHTAKVAQVSELEVHVQQLKKEKDELQRQLTTVQLLYEHTGPVGDGGSSASATGVGIGRGYAQEEALREQLQLYRSKWQAAEDQMEHLHERISQLQRQLVASGADDMATAGPLKPLLRVPSGDIQAVVQEAKYTADMVALRRQHQEQLQQHIEEEQRLQRRLERAQENAAFHEDQLRQQRQDDARQHHSEVQALQAQLRTAQGELVKAQEDREHLARQLRRSTEQQTTVEVLRSQVDQLKQRLGEVGAELAQVHGREKEVSLQVQRERLQRVKSQHDLEVAQEMLEREKMEAQYLREELIIAREQLGMHEATDASVTGTAPARSCLSSTCAPSATDTEAKPCRSGARTARGTVGAEGDAETLSSELKGYVGLMRVNTALQRRINELEAQVLAPHGREKAKSESTNSTEGEMQQAKLTNLPSEKCGWSKASPDNASPTSALEQQQAVHLEAELASALQSQRALMESFAEAEKERRQLIKDNQTLADGVELLEKQLCKYQAKCALKAITVDIKATHAEGGPQRRCHRCSSTQECESRVRSRLNKARTQDHHVEVQQSAGGQLQLSHAKENESATQSLCPVSGSCRDSPGPPAATTCTTRSASAAPFTAAHGIAVTGAADRTRIMCFHSAPSPHSLSASQSSPPDTQGDDTRPPALTGRSHSSAEQPEEKISPETPLPCRCVHGSILPPVYYPPLVARLLD